MLAEILLAGIIAAGRPVASAPPHDRIASPPQTAMQRIADIRWSLPVPRGWHFVVLDEVKWNQMVSANGLRGNRPQSAMSSLDGGFTYVREQYVDTAEYWRLRHTIAHEMGHRICNCTDEVTADKIADQILTQGSR